MKSWMSSVLVDLLVHYTVFIIIQVSYHANRKSDPEVAWWITQQTSLERTPCTSQRAGPPTSKTKCDPKAAWWIFIPSGYAASLSSFIMEMSFSLNIVPCARNSSWETRVSAPRGRLRSLSARQTFQS